MEDEINAKPEAHQEYNNAKFELFVELYALEQLTYRRENDQAAELNDYINVCGENIKEDNNFTYDTKAEYVESHNESEDEPINDDLLTVSTNHLDDDDTKNDTQLKMVKIFVIKFVDDM